MNGKIKFNVPEEDVNVLPEVEDTEQTLDDTLDNMETIQDDTEEQFYASGVYNELRDAMQDTDFRLFLIGNDIVIPGTLEGNDIQLLDLVGDEDSEEFVMKPAPTTLKELLGFRTLYNVENSELVDAETEVESAPHEKIVEYILNLKLVDKDAEDVEDDEQEIEAIEKEEEDDENAEQE